MQRKPFYDLPGPTEPGLNLLEYTENILQLYNPDSHHCERCGKRIWSSGKVSFYSRGFIWSCNEKPRTLAAFDVFLDLSWEEGNSRMSIFISDESLEKGAAQCAEQSQSAQNDEPDPEPVPVPYTPVKWRGRPTAKPINDVSPGHVYHMRFMEVPAETIAEEIRVFRRTLFRRLADISVKDICPDPPFSQWNC